MFSRSDEPTPSTTAFDLADGGPPDTTAFDLVVLTGSTARIGQPEPWYPALEEYVRRLVDADVPILGVCFGHQFLADRFGGTVTPLSDRQVGVSTIELTAEGESHPVFDGLPDRFDSFVYHHDHVQALPDSASLLARNDTGVQAFTLGDRPVVGIQFHPEFSGSMARAVGYEGPVDIATSQRIYPNQLRLARRRRSAGAVEDR